MNGKKLTVISTFAGCGGSSLGYKNAGFEELLAIDFSDVPVETFKLNFPDIKVWNKDITKVSVEDILTECNLKKGELSILDGSPPCQGFSTAGKRNVSDLRNSLFKDYIRLIEGLEPKVFVMENVKGMIVGKMKGNFKEITRRLKSLDYNIKCKLMDSKFYDVPQSRERIIWIGVHKSINKDFNFPKQSTNMISVKDAIKDLPIDKKVNITGNALKYWLMCPIGKSFSKVNIKGNWFNSYKLNPFKSSSTITKKMNLYHWKYPRKLNIAELKRLASFPDDFKMFGTYNQQCGVIGNAVMPKFMEAIAKQIKRDIFD